MNKQYDELLVELECPICTNYMSPPIWQCINGHSVCEACRRKLRKCALCRGKFTESRNLSLEGVALKMLNRQSSGCELQLSYTEREPHELRCSRKGFRCAMENCSWTGERLEDLAAHWASKLSIYCIPYQESNVCCTVMKGESYDVNMVLAHNKLFWYKCKLARNKLFWAVQFIGEAAEAENYYYEIEMIKPRSKKKILMSGYCQSLELENSHLFNDRNCISINVDSVSDFVQSLDDQDVLLYYMRVNEKVQVAQFPLNATYLSLISVTLLITFLWYKSAFISFRNKIFDYFWPPQPWYKKIW